MRTQELTEQETEQLWLHRAIAGKFVANPAPLLALAEVTIRRLRRDHPDGDEWAWLDRWRAVLLDGPETVLEAMTSSAEYAVELRGTSPFVGVLSEVERRTVLDALAETRREQARPARLEILQRVMRAV